VLRSQAPDAPWPSSVLLGSSLGWSLEEAISDWLQGHIDLFLSIELVGEEEIEGKDEDSALNTEYLLSGESSTVGNGELHEPLRCPVSVLLLSNSLESHREEELQLPNTYDERIRRLRSKLSGKAVVEVPDVAQDTLKLPEIPVLSEVPATLHGFEHAVELTPIEDSLALGVVELIPDEILYDGLGLLILHGDFLGFLFG